MLKSGSSDYHKMLFFLISMQIGIFFFLSGKFELEVPLTETSKEINILFLLFPQISSSSKSNVLGSKEISIQLI